MTSHNPIPGMHTFELSRRQWLMGAAALGALPSIAQEENLSLKGRRVALCVAGTSHYYNIKTFNAQIAEVKRLGGIPVMYDAGYVDKNISENLERLLDDKPDAVLQTQGSNKILDPILKKIAEAGIPLFTISVPSTYSINTTNSDNVAIGTEIGKVIAKDLNGVGNLMLFSSYYRDHKFDLEIERYEALFAAIKPFPQIKLIPQELKEVIPNTVQNAFDQVTDMLPKYRKGEISALFCGWDVPLFGAAKALKAAGRTEIRIYGVDGTPDLLGLMKDPSMPSITIMSQQPALIGKVAVQNIARWLGGSRNLPKRTYVPALLTTAANVAEVQKIRGD